MERRKSPTLIVSLFLFFAISASGPVDARDSCMAGTYLVKEGSGTQSLWTLSDDGTLQITSSSQIVFNFSHIQGAWRQTKRHHARAVGLDFNFMTEPVGNGVPPASIARLDISLSFSRNCREMQGDFELRFFDSETEDPLDLSTGPGAPTSQDTFEGRRVRVK